MAPAPFRSIVPSPGIGELAPGLDIVGRSSDGLLEAFEHRDRG